MVYESELYHYGIKGQKWGIRRYQNYDGSYTKAGMKRYNSAVDTYEKKHAEYKDAKKSGIKGDALKLKKAKVKEAKREVKKHYKHLKLDKQADKGKILYASGKRITFDNKVSDALAKIGSLSLTAAVYNKRTNKLGNDNVTKALAAIGGASLAASGIKRAVDYVPQNRLRAYYSHTSNY